MEPTCNQNGAKMLAWSFPGCLWESICFLMKKSGQHGWKKGSKWGTNLRKCGQKTSIKREACSDTLFDVFSMIFELFLDRFFYIFLVFFQEFEKGPTCVTTAPWRVDWGSDLPKSNQHRFKFQLKSMSKKITSNTYKQKLIFIHFWNFLGIKNG